MLKWIAGATVLLTLVINASFAATPDERERALKIILKSQRLGAHGMGYNAESFKELSTKFSASDIPVLLDLYSKPPEVRDTRAVQIGAQFAIASLCQSGANAIVDSVQKNVMTEIEAVVGLDAITGLDHCDEKTRENAKAAILKIKKLAEKKNDQLRAQHLKVETNDQRIQQNSLKMYGPQAKQNLSKQEREEVFQRSIKAMGLDGKRTPAQEELYRHMYESMVLAKPPEANSQGH